MRMKRFCVSSLLTLLALAGPAGGETRRAEFQGAGSEQTWPLKDLDANLPADWSSAKFLILEMRLSSPQRFDLRIQNANGVRAVKLSPVPGVWIRTAVPLAYFTQPAGQGHDLASVHNKARKLLFINLSGTPGPLNDVRGVSVFMANPVGKPVVEIRSVKLANEDPGDTLLEAKPLVDQFGQWIHDDWPGKARDLEQLKAAWAAEEKALASAEPIYCKFGGYLGTKAKATGFFRTEKIDGKWWLVDPDGHLFFSAGSDCINSSDVTMTQGREELFAALPPAEASGGRPGVRGGASFYTWNLVRRFGADWRPKWIDLTVRRMFAWGLNTVGNWSDPQLGSARRVPYVVTMRGWGIENGPMGVPDVYGADYAQAVDQAAAQQCDSHKDDPYVLGYFLGNEPPWPGRESVAVDAILAGPPTTLKKALAAFLAEGDTPERRKAFLYQTYQRFVETANAAIKRHDPNHLSLGLRFGGSAPADIIRASKVFDIYSLNNYAYAVNKAELDKIRSLIDKPVVIGEFHFGTPGRGMTAGLKQGSNQEERGVAYRYYVENAAADPSIVGTHWFQWIDEPSTGRSDGENYNIGMLDVTDRPYTELIDAALATHKRLLQVHAGKEAPVTRQAKVQ
jgi:hypothetical protein